MSKNIETPIIQPLPLHMIASYDKDRKVDVMPAAWAGQCGPNLIELNLAPAHKTVKNIEESKAFTVSYATKDTLAVSDYFGIVSANDTDDKIEKADVTVEKSENVNAPIIKEYPITVECKLVDTIDFHGECKIVGEIVNTIVSEDILDDEGNVDIGKAELITFDSVSRTYRLVGDVVGNAWSDGKKYISD